MDKKDEFKKFVKIHPNLINHVKNGSGSWQKLFEVYDMYGEDKEAWQKYLEPVVAATSTSSLADMMGWFKNINLDEVESGINNIQKVIGMVQDMTGKKGTTKEEYKPRPVYKHFED